MGNIFSRTENQQNPEAESLDLEKQEPTEFKQSAHERDVVHVQTRLRGFIARKKYRIHPLANSEQTSYRTFVVGNDPKMPSELNQYHEPDDKIALIATSGLRAISLACKIGNPAKTPKIILIDNSRQVYKFWYAFRDFVQDDNSADKEALFLRQLPNFLDRHSDLYKNLADDAMASDFNEGVTYLNQNTGVYLRTLINKYGYDYVRAVILHTVLIKQSWADKDVFIKLKNILNHNGISKIYMYPSNIVACIADEATRNQVLKNIEEVCPVLSIHTDYCDTHGVPEKVYLLENQNHNAVSEKIFSGSSCQPLFPRGPFRCIKVPEMSYLLEMLQAIGGDDESAQFAHFLASRSL